MNFGEEEVVKKRVTAKKIKIITESIFSTLFDVTLYTLSLPLLSLGKSATSKNVYETFKEADALLEEINYKKFKHSIQVLRQNGLIEGLRDWSKQEAITKAGRTRLKNILPIYDSKRLWNGKLYLISYDFPRKDNHLRDRFREFIKKSGAIILQDSLYLTPNNPYTLIHDFQKDHHYQGMILISELSKKGFVGKEDLKSFLWNISGLDRINLQYQEFINDNKDTKNGKSLLNISLVYYSILQKDPQLPYSLLKEEYLGDEAYLLFQKLTKKKKIS